MLLLGTHTGHRGMCAARDTLDIEGCVLLLLGTHIGHRGVCGARDTHWT